MYKHFFKRFLDFWISLVVLILISPVLIVVTIWLHFANKGAGAFFTQERPGKDGKIFKVIKYKTMTDERDAEGNLLPDEARLTKVGKFVRSTSIDELPQLINVLKGDMSFIGYRPERQVYIDQIMAANPRYRYLYQIRPGVTSYATLYNGYTDTLEKMMNRLDLDLYYLRNHSVGFDVYVLGMTFLKIVTGKSF